MNAALAVLLTALETVSEKDPQSDTCGPSAPDICENGCIGCVARAALSEAKLLLDSCPYSDGWTEEEREDIAEGRI